MEEILCKGNIDDLNKYIKDYLHLDNHDYEFDYSEEFDENCDNTSYHYNSAEFALRSKNYDMAIYLVNNFNIKCNKRAVCKYGNINFILKTNYTDFNIFDICQYENLELLEYLLSMNYCSYNSEKQIKFINQKNKFGETPLIIACKFGNYKTILELFNTFLDKIDVNIECDYGFNAFYHALFTFNNYNENTYNIVKTLLDKNIEIKPNQNYMGQFISGNEYEKLTFDLIISKVPDFYKYCSTLHDDIFGISCKRSLNNIIKYFISHKDYFNLTDKIIQNGLNYDYKNMKL